MMPEDMAVRFPTYDQAIAEVARLREAYAKMDNEVEQTLGKALGYPEYTAEDFEDGKPDGTVCVGEHVPESLAAEAAAEIARLRSALQEILDSEPGSDGNLKFWGRYAVTTIARHALLRPGSSHG